MWVNTNGWRMNDVVPAAEIVKMIEREMPLKPLTRTIAAKWPSAGVKDGSGEIGVMASVTQAFCSIVIVHASLPKASFIPVSFRDQGT